MINTLTNQINKTYHFTKQTEEKMELAHMDSHAVADSIYVHNMDLSGRVAQFRPLSNKYDQLLRTSSNFMVSSLAKPMTDYFTAFRKYRNALDGEVIKLSFANSILSALVANLEKPQEFATVLKAHLRVIEDLCSCDEAFNEFNLATQQLSLKLSEYLGDLHQDPSLVEIEAKIESKKLEITRELQALSKLEERIRLIQLCGNDSAKIKANLEARLNEVTSTIPEVERLLQKAIDKQRNSVHVARNSTWFGFIRSSRVVVENVQTQAQQQGYRDRLDDLRKELKSINDELQNFSNGEQNSIRTIGVVSDTELESQRERILQLQKQEKDLLSKYEVAKANSFRAIDARLQAGDDKTVVEKGFGEMLNLASQMATSLDFVRNFIVQLKNVVRIFNETPGMSQLTATNYMQAIGFVVRIPIIANAYLNGTDRPRIMEDVIYQHQFMQVTQYRQQIIWMAREKGKYITEEVEQPLRNVQETRLPNVNTDGYNVLM